MSEKYSEIRDLLIGKFTEPADELDEPQEVFVEPEEDIVEEMVSHPAHYNHGTYETIDVIEDWELGFHCGNAIKYISRHAHKGAPIRDVEKAIWYLERHLEILQEDE